MHDGRLARSLVIALFFLLSSGIFLIGPSSTEVLGAEEETFEYVGVTKCKMCHKSAKQGEQFGLWEKTGHAKAFETLATDAALAEAKERGIENPQTAPECLKCHATAFAVMDDLENQKITLEEGVSCESCHGPGKSYMKKKTMTAIRAGEVDGASLGLIQPTEEVCVECHTPEGNSFFKEFVYEERIQKIPHPIPEAAEGEAEAADAEAEAEAET